MPSGNTTTTGESAAGPLNGSELVRGVQSGGNVKMTTQAIANLGYASPGTATGDLIVHGSGADQRLPVGNDTLQLVADSSQPLGIKWFDAIGALASKLGTYLGATLIGFLPVGTGGVLTTLYAKLTQPQFVSPLDYGGVGDGVADDSAAVLRALAVSPNLDLRGKSWKFGSTITLAGGNTVDMRGANIIAACGSTPIFQTLNGNSSIHFRHGGGVVSGTASCFLFAQGKTNQPAAQSDYATQIHLDSVLISSPTIITALVFDRAVKSVYIRGANFFTPNGISASGACVEVMVSDSIIYSATGVAGTSGIKLRSTGGTTYYNQGWSIVNSTIDNFEISNDVSDCFVYTITGGYTACAAALAATTGYACQFQAPLNTNLTDTMTIGGGAVIGGRIRFASAGAGQAYNANINATFSGVPGTAIAIENNAANITITGSKFKAGSGSPVGVVGTNNNANIVATGLDFDSTYTGGVILNGANGTGCSIRGITYAGSGDPFYVARPVLINDVPVQTANGAGFKRQFNPSDLAGTYAVAAAISSQAITFAKGETGWIVASLPCSGMSAATQRFDVTAPSGMVTPSGTGWASGFNYPSAASALVALRIPYYCTTDGSGALSITNGAGNSVTLNSHGYFGIERAF